MIEYKLDKKPTVTINATIRDMYGVLKEVSETYRLLLESLEAQEASLSLTGINDFRNELKALLKNGIVTAEAISEQSEKLVVVSEQATKHLLAFEKHFSEALQKHAQKVNITQAS